jgi:hypothetical protein
MAVNPASAKFRTLSSSLLCVICFSSALLLAGCSTQYGQAGITGGFTDKMISNDIGVVVISGNGFTSAAKVKAMLLLRASEMTLESGHRRFSLLSIEDQAALDAQKAGRLPAYLRQKAARGASKLELRTSQTLIYSNGITMNVNKSGGGFFVVMHKGGAYDARQLVATLKPKLQRGHDTGPAPKIP